MEQQGDFSFSKIYKQLNAIWNKKDLIINKISTDTRTIEKGDIFLSLKGNNFDGNDYIDLAIEKGASGLIINKDIITDLPTLKVSDTSIAYALIAKIKRQMFNIPIIGITGSCGKTSVKNMLYSILSKKAKTLATDKNFNNEIGVPQTLLKLNSNFKYAIIEMGAGKEKDIEYLANIVKPDISLVNNIGPSHLENLKTIDGVSNEKANIYRFMQTNGTAVINVDDLYAPYMMSCLTTQDIVTYSLFNTADISAKKIITGNKKGVNFNLISKNGEINVQLPVLGTHNVANALAASAIAITVGASLVEVKAGLESFKATEFRLEQKDAINGARLIDDSYNANPVSTIAAMQTLAEFPGKKIFVMGDMGELGSIADEQHKLIGAEAKRQGIDYIFSLGNLTKNTVKEFGENGKHYTNKTKLINDLKNILDKSTTVLVKGSRFMKMDEISKSIV